MASVVREAVIAAPAARCWDAHYNASAQVIPVDAATCRFVWAIG